MLLDILQKLFERDLHKLESEIGQYRKEDNLWCIEQSIANSGGNLCLHLVGNLNAFIGTELGKTGYVRHREAEFALKNVPQQELLQMVMDTRTTVAKVLSTLAEEDLNKTYPIQVFGYPMTTGYFLTHLATHLAYHLGQINYHRRLLDV